MLAALHEFGKLVSVREYVFQESMGEIDDILSLLAIHRYVYIVGSFVSRNPKGIRPLKETLVDNVGSQELAELALKITGTNLMLDANCLKSLAA